MITPPFFMTKALYLVVISLILVSFLFLPIYERDVLLYQLSVPKFWLNKDLFSPPFSHFFYYPWLPFLFNYLCLSIESVFLANALHLTLAFATVFLVYKTIPNRDVAFYLALLLMTLMPFLRFSYVAYVDFYLLFFSFGALIFALRAFKCHDRFSFFLSAILCGLGLNTKYNMLVFALLLYFFVFWLSYHTFKDFKRALEGLGTYLFISFALFFPFLLKNFFLTGSPLYPFFTDLFPTTNQFAFKNVSHFAFRRYFFGENLLQILLNPIMAFFYGVENDIQFFDGVLNPFFVIFPIIAIFAMKDKLITALFFFGWLYNYFVLFLEPVSARFLLPSVPIFAYIAGAYLSRLRLSEKRLFFIFVPFLIFNLYFGGRHIVDRDKWLYLTGRLSKDDFLEKKCPDYRAITFINEKTPKSAVIFYLFSGQRTFYIERDFIYDSFNDGRLFKKIFEGASYEKTFLERLKGYGITHLFIRKDLFEQFLSDNFQEKELNILNKFFQNYVKVVFQDGVFLVVELSGDEKK